jgi:hypothetical protein
LLRRLPGLTSKNSPGTQITWARERLAEEAHPVIERRRQVRDRAPDVEGPVRRAIGADAHRLEPPQHPRPLLAEGLVDGAGLGLDVGVAEERDGSPLQGPAPAAVEEATRARDRFDHRARPHGPGHPPALAVEAGPGR